MSIRIIPKKGKQSQILSEKSNWEAKEASVYQRERNSLKANSEQFQIPKLGFIYVMDQRKIVHKSRSRIRKKELLKLSKHYPNAEILIEYGENMFKSIGIKVFKKLTKIKSLTISREYEFCTPDELDEHNVDWTTPAYKQISHVFSIHHLIKELASENSYEEMLEYVMSSGMFLLSGADKKIHIEYNSGSIESMSYLDFLKKYKLSFETIQPIQRKYKSLQLTNLSY